MHIVVMQFQLIVYFMPFLSGVNVNVSLKNIYRRRRMSRVRIGGASDRRNVRLSRMQQRTVLFSVVPWRWWW